MSRGGFREGAGRPKGSQDKRTQIIAQKAAEEGTTPIEVMLKAMRYALGQAYKEDGTVDFDMLKAANDFAAQAAPYIHPRLAANKQEHSGSLSLEQIITNSMSLDDQRALLGALEAIDADKSGLH